LPFGSLAQRNFKTPKFCWLFIVRRALLPESKTCPSVYRSTGGSQRKARSHGANKARIDPGETISRGEKA
jgi:hypothetical protein